LTPHYLNKSYGKIYISADSQRQITFIRSATRAAKAKNFQCLYPPSQSGGPSYETMLRKVLDWLNESIFIVMDVTPHRMGNRWVTNPGVLIEFGIIAATDKLDQLSLFREESSPINRIHPFIRAKEIIPYSVNHPRILTRLIKEEIDKFIKARLHRPKSPIRPYG